MVDVCKALCDVAYVVGMHAVLILLCLASLHHHGFQAETVDTEEEAALGNSSFSSLGATTREQIAMQTDTHVTLALLSSMQSCAGKFWLIIWLRSVLS